MATITLDLKKKTLVAALSAVEFDAIKADFDVKGSIGFESLFQSYVEQAHRSLSTKQIVKIKQLVETATDGQRAAVLELFEML